MKTYIICCVSVHILFGKNLAPGIWTKMLSANQIAVFLQK